MHKPTGSNTSSRSFLQALLTFLFLLATSYGVLALLKKTNPVLPDSSIAGPAKAPRVTLKRKFESLPATESDFTPLRPKSRTFRPEPGDIQRLMDEGKVKDSALLLDQLLANDPENADYLYQKAILAAREQEDHETARYLLEKVLQQDPNHLEAADELYSVYERMEDFEGAIAALEKMEKQGESEQYGISYSLGRLYLETGQADKARHRLEKALQSGADHPWIREQLAAAYKKLGQTERARQEWQTLAQDEGLGRPSLNAKARLAEVLYAEGRYAEAEVYLKEVLEQDPQHGLGTLLKQETGLANFL